MRTWKSQPNSWGCLRIITQLSQNPASAGLQHMTSILETLKCAKLCIKVLPLMRWSHPACDELNSEGRRWGRRCGLNEWKIVIPWDDCECAVQLVRGMRTVMRCLWGVASCGDKRIVVVQQRTQMVHLVAGDLPKPDIATHPKRNYWKTSFSFGSGTTSLFLFFFHPLQVTVTFFSGLGAKFISLFMHPTTKIVQGGKTYIHIF